MSKASKEILVCVCVCVCVCVFSFGVRIGLWVRTLTSLSCHCLTERISCRQVVYLQLCERV